MDTYNFLVNLYNDIIKKDHCLGVVIYWPKSHIYINENDIDYNFKKIYSGNIEVDINFGINILREIHYGKQWWEKHLINETNKRFYNNNELVENKNKNNLKFELYVSENLHKTFKGLKKKMREKYNVDKSEFHFSDPDCLEHLGINCSCEVYKNDFNKETYKHIHLLSHPNTIHFLKKSTYKPEYNFNKYLNTYIYWLNTIKNKKNILDFCIDNGGILGAYGLRDTHDIDFIYFPIIYLNCKDKQTNNFDNFDIKYNYIDCENKNHRNEYLKINYKIEDIIHNPNNYFYHFGCKFMSINILKKFKFNRTHTIGDGQKKIRKKDIDDYNIITNNL